MNRRYLTHWPQPSISRPNPILNLKQTEAATGQPHRHQLQHLLSVHQALSHSYKHTNHAETLYSHIPLSPYCHFTSPFLSSIIPLAFVSCCPLPPSSVTVAADVSSTSLLQSTREPGGRLQPGTTTYPDRARLRRAASLIPRPAGGGAQRAPPPCGFSQIAPEVLGISL